MKNKNREPQQSQDEHHSNPDEIQRRAYELYQARGEEPGHELEDWLQAEKEVNHRGEVAHRG